MAGLNEYLEKEKKIFEDIENIFKETSENKPSMLKTFLIGTVKGIDAGIDIFLNSLSSFNINDLF